MKTYMAINISLGIHCLKVSVFAVILVRIFLYFPRYGVSLHIQSECGKMQTRITPNTDTFHAVIVICNLGRSLIVFLILFRMLIK